MPSHKLPLLCLSLSAILLGACADRPQRAEAPPPAPKAAAPAPAPAPTRRAMPAPIVDEARPTGIPECDSYLARYRACHRVLGIYAAEQLEERYAGTRATLIDRAGDEPAEAVAASCNALSQLMDEALDERECEPYVEIEADDGLGAQFQD